MQHAYHYIDNLIYKPNSVIIPIYGNATELRDSLSHLFNLLPHHVFYGSSVVVNHAETNRYYSTCGPRNMELYQWGFLQAYEEEGLIIKSLFWYLRGTPCCHKTTLCPLLLKDTPCQRSGRHRLVLYTGTTIVFHRGGQFVPEALRQKVKISALKITV